MKNKKTIIAIVSAISANCNHRNCCNYNNEK